MLKKTNISLKGFSFLKKTMQIIFLRMLAVALPSVWQELL